MTEKPRETVGDEFQGVLYSRADALVFTALARLALPAGIDVRFGLGAGGRARVTSSGLQDGPGWWAAREAIDEVSKRQAGRFPTTRTWYKAEQIGPAAPASRDLDEALVNAYLLDRDAVLVGLGDRERAWVRGVLAGSTQSELARRSGVSQPAVSQALARSGAAQVIEGLRLLMGEGR